MSNKSNEREYRTASVIAAVAELFNAALRYGDPTGLGSNKEFLKFAERIKHAYSPIGGRQTMINDACVCEIISQAMLDGHPNPESAEEWRQVRGHYAECPAISLH
jgi:hypothetical protein